MFLKKGHGPKHVIKERKNCLEFIVSIPGQIENFREYVHVIFYGNKKKYIMAGTLKYLEQSLIYEPPHDKTKKMTMRPAKTHISLCIRPVWSVFAVRSRVAKDPSLHADSEDFDQTGCMPRLIWVFAGCTVILLVLTCSGSYMGCCWYKVVTLDNFSCIWAKIKRKPPIASHSLLWARVSWFWEQGPCKKNETWQTYLHTCDISLFCPFLRKSP